MSGTDFVVLGEVGARVDGRPVPISGRRERAVLAELLAAGRRTVSADRLLEDVWGPDRADTAAASLQVAVSHLRSCLEPGRGPRGRARVLLTRDGGYALDHEPDRLDADVFARTTGEALSEAAAGRPAQALASSDAALALWRGTPYDGAPDTTAVTAERERLEQLRLVALETRAQALLDLGRHAEVAGEIVAHIGAHPYRERLWELGALAHYRDGRQADALALLRRARRTLANELGIDPSPALQQLEARILAQDVGLQPGRPAEPARTERPARTAALPIARDAEFAQLRALAVEAKTGRACFALVEGDPGIGKTRLLETLADWCGSNEMAVAWGRCVDAESVPAFAPWTAVLQELQRRGTTIPVDPAADSGAPGVDELPADRRFRLFDLATDAIVAAARTQPLVLLLEDLHWADPATAGLLTHVVSRLQGVPVLLVVSIRELDLGRLDAVTTAVSALVRRATTRRIALRPLPVSASSDLVVSVTGRRVDPAVADAIHRRGGGNPFCMSELVRLLAADGLLDDPTAVQTASVPASVRDVVRRRLAALPPVSRGLLEVASVLGREVELPILIATSGMPLESCLDALEPALVQRMLVRDSESPGRYRFAHALVDEVVIAECSPLRSARLHLRAAKALEAAGGDAEAIAGHLWSAGALAPPDEVAEALERAATVAIARAAYERAEQLLDRAVTTRRAAGEGGGEASAAEVTTTLRLSGLRRSLFGYRAALERVPVERVDSAARALGRTDLSMAVLHLRWGAAATSCRIQEATVAAREMLDLGATDPDPVVRCVAHHAWGVQCWHLARFREAADEMSEARALQDAFTGEQVERLGAYDNPALFAGFAVLILDLAGRIADADACFDRLLERYSGEYAALVIRNFQGQSALVAADPGRVLAWNARHGFTEPVDRRLGMFAASVTVYAGWASAMTGHPESGLAAVEDGLTQYTRLGARTAYGVFLDAHVQALLAAERPLAHVAQVLEVGARIVEDSEEPYALASLDLARARLLDAAMRHEEAHELLLAAADRVERSGNVRLAAVIAERIALSGLEHR